MDDSVKEAGQGPRFLLIVSRDRPEHYRRLRAVFVDDPMMTVLFDRRYHAEPLPPAEERRRRDISGELRDPGWATVRFGTTPEPGSGLPDRPRPREHERAAGPSVAARILVVDDDPVVLEMVATVLDTGGYAPTVISDSREALALLDTERFDLLISDFVMPHVDGLQLLEKARERNPGAAVLMMSGFGTGQLVRESLHRGAADFVPKPFEVVAFLSMVDEILTRSRP